MQKSATFFRTHSFYFWDIVPVCLLPVGLNKIILKVLAIKSGSWSVINIQVTLLVVQLLVESSASYTVV